MQSKVIFAITSQGNDFYSATTRVAVASLRISNPSLLLVVACDRDTDLALKQARDPLIKEVDEWLIVDTPNGNAYFRNRYVKTSLRSFVDGPFLFLDSDILVRGDLKEIFALDTDIAGARNHSRIAFSEQVWAKDSAALDAMGWTIGKEVYVNGGVIFWNDTQGARQFGAEWHRRWLKSFVERGYYRDQPALNSALHDTQPQITVLPDCYNAQIKMNPSMAKDAIIWHYYSAITGRAITAFEVIVAKLLRGNKLDNSVIKKIIAHRHPWRHDFWIDDWIANRVMQRGRFKEWEIVWLSGKRLKAIVKRLLLLRDID